MYREVTTQALAAALIALLTGACAGTDEQAGTQESVAPAAAEQAAGDHDPVVAAPGNLAGDKDADGFVRLPGEPSRGDAAYHVTGDVCDQFTGEYLQGLLGKSVLKAAPTNPAAANCQYDLGPPHANGVVPNVLLSLSFLPIERQVEGHRLMDRTVARDPAIPMANQVVTQENGLINEIYLVLGPNKFLSLNRGPGSGVSEEEFAALARKLGAKLGQFK